MNSELRIAILASFNLDLLSRYLGPRLEAAEFAPSFYTPGYAQYPQEILQEDSGFYRFDPNITLLVLDAANWFAQWHQDPLACRVSQAREIAEIALRELEDLLTQIETRLSQNVTLLHTVFWPPRTSLRLLEANSEWSLKALTDHFNIGLVSLAGNHSRRWVVDVEARVMELGYRHWADDRLWSLGRMRWSRQALDMMAQHYVSILKALYRPRKKCLVLDLDNTLWGGVLGEDGPGGIQLGTDGIGLAFREFQQEILNLYKQGVLLAINSKNNEHDAMEIIASHPGMVLRPEHFAAIQINWSDKANNMRVIAESLNIGLESLVFADDNPAERQLIRTLLPEVTVLELLADPADYKRVLLECDGFDTLKLSEEDRRRGELYAQQHQREALRATASNLEDFYQSLQQVVTIRKGDKLTIPRIAQLTHKTNQFNLTTRRYTETDIESFCNSPDHRVYTLQVKDRFGDNGIVGVATLVGEDAGRTWRLDTFLMSCRVIGRTVETAFLGYIVNEALRAGVRRLVGEFIPTRKNTPAKDFLPSHGFRRERGDERNTRWALELSLGIVPIPKWIQVEDV